ncbi:2,5-diamino-6-(ribosylamino)-4(3H)-pyrimidinone 5'-phosphate reductase [Haloferax volcanii]|uniref:2,5-diamino-6-(ribosylamino)-4(3H)-pyrimidinone 5'-phosphate reductase n=3 Tax=Haloferax volcanii TaxID=2246 RepID=D4GXL5_HALVD|nr:2,5-diamino-6-(ribosylamino)-4(3H)-pyrimidinone 5'-phosphate reductase [Haloferax volcanii]ADE03895.1 2,5-diamino-6-(ribosylamino)-4(3H)-pyrimidinone 5'-phosphate reductase [Haloferax volcanii DS2]ELY27972.1 5-amino-6-(5-phosphoribosylamino)uracil reductase [Haloferax volcanii DS2]MBS8117779.1 2,5-diamino-6-(ribosylamino)-4(3H)-pyrimidinone 5'-phosphate reductase [Haloferax volcanii]MBS8122791.1 2,5-diamino-6-(ribosylamino)-4(3H)-pyrimidinone 5'-phosphate reductase [Haloferax volcanii]MBS81
MHVHVNAAASLDGKLSSRRREQVTISGDDDFARVDEIRATADAVAVGVGTVLADDPHLTLDDPGLVAAREDRGDSPHPARVVADSRARTPTDARILDDAATTYLLVSEAAPGGRREALEAAGAELVVAGAERVSLPDAFDALEARGVDRLMVEGGGELIFSLFEAGLVDELTLYVGSLVIGGRDAPTLADGDGFVSDFPRLSLRDVERVDDGVLLTYDC